MDKNDIKTEDQFKAAHGYFVSDVWYPRVTSIVSIKAKPELYRFYGGLNSFAEGEAIKEKSAEEGTLVHETMEKILTGQDVNIDPSIEPSIRAATEFVKERNIQVDADWVEKRIINF